MISHPPLTSPLTSPQSRPRQIELLIKIFNSRATKHEEWMATKMAWLQVRQKILRVSVAEGENAPRLSVRRPSVRRPTPSHR